MELHHVKQMHVMLADLTVLNIFCSYLIILIYSEEVRISVGLVITELELILVKENHQWPLPRLQAPLDDANII
jgi:hypothetical protein